MTDPADLSELLQAWAPLIAQGYEVPAASTAMHEAASLIEAQKAEIANLNMALAFVYRWTWEKEGNGTSAEERLSAIKHYPMIAALKETKDA